MTHHFHRIAALLLAGSAMASGNSALAQGSSASRAGSMGNAAGNTYIELGIGRTDFSLSSGTGVFANERRDTSYRLATGSYFDNNVGMELGYTNFGSIQRGGGETRANALDLSAIGRVPLGASFNLLGRIGATYGRTTVTALPGSGITSGGQNGFGLNLGLGGEYLFNPQMSIVLQYDLHGLKFAGGSRDHIGNTSLGLRFRF